MLLRVIEERRRSLGHRMVGPFIFFDHMGPERFPKGVSRDVDVKPHPHIGLATISYLLEGEIMHRDSVGSEQAIRPGEVNWMTAGRGITHSERFEKARAEGGVMHGAQTWAALPEALEETEPAFFHHGMVDLPTFEERGAWGRLLAGRAFGLHAAVAVGSPMFYVHCELRPGGRIGLPDDYRERAAYVVRGVVEVDGIAHESGRILVFQPGQPATLQAGAPSIVMLLGGEPLGHRFIEWNFVSSSQERIDQAKADWRAGRMKLPDFDNHESIALPEGPPPPANPMS